MRTLDLDEPYSHAAWDGCRRARTPGTARSTTTGPDGNDDIGSLVTWDLAKATSKVIIGPKTGWPYPPGGHVSAVAIRQPGWVFLSVQGGGNTGRTLMDMEIIIANP